MANRRNKAHPETSSKSKETNIKSLHKGIQRNEISNLKQNALNMHGKYTFYQPYLNLHAGTNNILSSSPAITDVKEKLKSTVQNGKTLRSNDPQARPQSKGFKRCADYQQRLQLSQTLKRQSLQSLSTNLEFNNSPLEEYQEEDQLNETLEEDSSTESNDTGYGGFENEEIIYDGCPLSLSTSLLLVLTLCIRHNLSNEAMNDLLFLIWLHLKKPNNYRKTSKELRAHLQQNSSDSTFTKHYYCKFCFTTVENKSETTCRCCTTTLGESNIGHHIHLPIKDQLKRICENSKYIIMYIYSSYMYIYIFFFINY